MKRLLAIALIVTGAASAAIALATVVLIAPDFLSEIEEQEAALDKLEEQLDAIDESRLVIETDGLAFDDHHVLNLSGGRLPDEFRDRPAEGLSPLQAELDEVDDTYLGPIRAHALVSFRAAVAVMMTLHEVDGQWPISWRITGLEEATHRQGPSRPGLELPLPDGEPEERLELRVLVNAQGFYVTAANTRLEPKEGCDEVGPTICLADSVDVKALFEEARRAIDAGDEMEASRLFDEALDAYDFRRFYNLLSQLSAEYPGETTIYIGADMDLPMGLIDRLSETAAYRLPREHYDDRQSFEDAWKLGDVEGWLFPDPMYQVTM